MRTESQVLKIRKLIGRSLPVLIALVLIIPGSAQAQNLVWARQAGTQAGDIGYDVLADLSGAVIAGATWGDLAGPNQAGPDAFIRRYSGTGVPLWTRQWGTSAPDEAMALATGGSSLYVAGTTYAGAFVRSYDVDGNFQWSRKLRAYNAPISIVADETAVYVAAGDNGDVMIVKYASDGTKLWTRVFGTSAGDAVGGIALDGGGHLFVGGSTAGAFPTFTNAGFNDLFMRKYHLNGTALWTRQIGTTKDDLAAQAVANANGAYLSGATLGAFPGNSNAGGGDALIVKFRPAGALAWTSQFGTPYHDRIHDISLDDQGLVVGGETQGSLPGQVSNGFVDAFAARYRFDGSRVWILQLGGGGIDIGRGIAVSGGNIYLAGETSGTFEDATPNGYDDAFLAKIR